MTDKVYDVTALVLDSAALNSNQMTLNLYNSTGPGLIFHADGRLEITGTLSTDEATQEIARMLVEHYGKEFIKKKLQMEADHGHD